MPKFASAGPTPRKTMVFGPSPLTTKPAIRMFAESVPDWAREEMLTSLPGVGLLMTTRFAAVLVALPPLLVAVHV
jgi:hypothetical protein